MVFTEIWIGGLKMIGTRRFIAGTCLTMLLLLTIVSGCGGKDAQSRYQRGLDFFSKEDYSRAAIELQNALQQNPALTDARYHLALCFIRLGQPGSAQNQLERVLQEQPGHLGARVELIPFQIMANDTSASWDTIQDSLSREPDNARPLLLLAQGQLQRGALLDALNAIEQAAAIDSRDSEIQVTLARIALKLSQQFGGPQSAASQPATLEAKKWLERAERTVDRVLAEKGNHLEALLVRGQILVSRGDIEGADGVFARIREVAPDDPRALVSHFNYLFLLGKFDQAVQLAEEAVRKGNGSPLLEVMLSDGMLAQASLFQSQGDVQNAQDLFEKSRQLLSKNRSKSQQMAYALTLTGKPIQAEDIYSPALDMNLEPRERVQLLFAFGLLSLQTGKEDKARTLLNELRERFPESIETRRLEILLGLPAEEAKIAAERIYAEESPLLHQVLNNARLMHAFGQRKTVEELIALASRMAPHSPLPDYVMGVLLDQSDERESEALARFEAALIKDPHFMPSLLSIAELEIERRDYSSAAKRLEEYLQKVPDSSEAQSQLALALAAEGRIRESFDRLDRLAQTNPDPAPLMATLSQLAEQAGGHRILGAWADETLIDRPNSLGALLAKFQSERQAASEMEKRGLPEPARRHFGNAISALNRAQEEHPASILVLQIRASLALDSGQNDVAIELSERILRLQRGFKPALMTLILARERKGDWASALAACEQALEAYPDDARFQMFKAQGLSRQGRTREASALIRQLQTKDPLNPAYLSLLVQNALRRGQLSEAIQIVQGLRQMAPDQIMSALLLADLYQKAGEVEKAERLLAEIRQAHPNDLRVQMAQGALLAAKGAHAEAMNEYRAILQGQPGYFPALAQLGKEYLASGRLSQAEGLIQQARTGDDRNKLTLFLADEGLKIRQIEFAAKLYQSASEQIPEPFPAWIGLARVAAINRDKDAALRYFDSAIESASAEFRQTVLIEAGDVASASWESSPEDWNAQTRKAEAYYRAALEASSTRKGPILIRLARLTAQNGDHLTEEKYLEQALAHAEDNLVLKILLARAQEKNGKSEAAQKTTESVLEDLSKSEDPARLIASLGQSLSVLLGGDETLLEQYGTRKEDYAAQLLTGLIALNRASKAGLSGPERQGALENALDRFSEVKRLRPSSPFGYRLMAVASLRLGRRDEALRQFEEWLAIRPSDRLARIEAARLLAAKGNGPQALEQIDRAVQDHPGDPTVLLAKASLLAASPIRQTEQAIQIVQDLYVDRPGESRVASTLIALMGQQDRLDEAIEAGEKYLTHSPRDYTILTQLGEVYLRKGENLKALLCYQKTIEISPNAAQTANNLAYAYAVVGQQLDKALDLAQQALSAYPGNPRILDTLGFVYFKKEDWHSAIEVFGEALDIDPDQATTRYYLAESYYRVGNRELARKHVEQALEHSFPERKEAERLRDQLGRS